MDFQDSHMVEVNRDFKKYYNNYELFIKVSDGSGYQLYKPKGISLESVRMKQKKHPEKLYITLQDKIKELSGYQKQYNNQLKKLLKKDLVKAKKVIERTMTAALQEPKNQILENVKETIDILVKEYLESPDVVKNLIEVSTKDYSTSTHSINVMLLCFGFACYNHFCISDIKMFGLMGLLHDVGKIYVDDEILNVKKELTSREKKLLWKHTEHGFRILKELNFDEKIILGALEHHERIDGSGYPDGKIGDEMAYESRALAIIDEFDMLTNWRPSKEKIKPIEALGIMMDDVEGTKFDRDCFKVFAHSIVGMQ